MIKNILQFWKEKDFLTQELDDFDQMLKDAREIFIKGMAQVFARESPGLKLRDEVYRMDQSINERQRNIRKRVLSHLTFQPNEDLATALILMSVVKDAERLGDYAKNIFEVSDLADQPISEDVFHEWFQDMDRQLTDLFDLTRKSFMESDEKGAREIMRIERTIVHACDDGLRKLAKSGIDSNTAVCITLLFRYLKRVGAHLGNIASSVIMPISDLDYYDEKKRQKG